MTLVQLHAAAVCTWLGLVAGETVLELMQRDAGSRRYIADVHARIDALVEVPLILLVLGTGGMLLAQAWPAPGIVLAKVGAALVAVLTNIVCMVMVRQRFHAGDDARVLDLTRKIRLTGLAIPFGVAALVIGYFYLPR